MASEVLTTPERQSERLSGVRTHPIDGERYVRPLSDDRFSEPARCRCSERRAIKAGHSTASTICAESACKGRTRVGRPSRNTRGRCRGASRRSCQKAACSARHHVPLRRADPAERSVIVSRGLVCLGNLLGVADHRDLAVAHCRKCRPVEGMRRIHIVHQLLLRQP